MINYNIKLRVQKQMTPKKFYKRPKQSEILLMKDDQVGRCAICEEILSEDTKHIHVDHCHKTNITRGLLCANCNKGLGFFKDKISNLEKAISYLKG
jgi:nitrate/TMAO reductase-like tetraheme cytochrome c subunit